MKKIVIFSLLLIAAIGANAKNYYFNPSGSDTNGCTIGSPCKTPQKAASIATNPGDSLLFQTNGTYYIPMNFTHSGTAANPIVISSYGTGAQPVFTLQPVTSWNTPASGSTVWTKTTPNHPGTIVFYQDGVPLVPEASNASCTDGKWFGDGTKLYFNPGSGSPNSTYVITYANLGSPEPGYVPAIDLSGVSYVTVSNINFTAVGIGVKTFEVSAGTNGLTIQNCSFNYCQRAIFMMPGPNGNTGATVKNCYFYRCQCAVNMYTWIAEGPNAGSTAGTNTNCSILNNEMNQCGTIDGTTHWNIGTDFEGIGINNFMNGTISGNYVHDGFCIGLSWFNIKTRESSNNTIKGNTWSNTHKGAMILVGDTATVAGVHGAYDYAYNNNRFYQNTILPGCVYSGVFGASVVFFQGALTSSQNYWVNNTLSGDQNLIYFANANAPYFTIENNIFYDSGQYRFMNWTWTTKPASLTLDYNLYYEDSNNLGGSGHTAGAASLGWVFGFARNQTYVNGKGMENHSKYGNPLFVNTASANYHLQTGSAAIQSGTNVGLGAGSTPDQGAIPYLLAPVTRYSIPVNVYTYGYGITSLSPVNSAGAPDSYSISPALPAGLHFDATTGIVYGTPTAISASGPYTVTATNGAGSSSTSLTIGVTPAPLTIVANSKSKTPGAALPALTVTYSGFVNGDTPASLATQPSVSTSCSSGSPAGNYPITATGAASSNYTITYVDGVMLVQSAGAVVVHHRFGGIVPLN